MIIVCATDDNFVQHCCVMLVSLLMNNRDVVIYVLTEGLKPENQRVIEEEVAAKGGTLHFRIVDPSVIDRFPMPGGAELAHISRATYYRLLIAELLPLQVEKVLYLDCDIVVNGPIDQLWHTPIDGYALAAVLQTGFGSQAVRLGYPMEYGYFNAGVALMNLRYFRKYDVCRQLMHYISSHYDSIKYHDQDTLNAVLHDQTLHLMPQWNMTSGIYAPGYHRQVDRQNGQIVNDYATEKNNALAHKRHPLILHYVAKPKPWQPGCTHPLCMLYYHYACQTIHFAHIKPQSPLARWWAAWRYNATMRLSLLRHDLLLVWGDD
jgi:lipopolysaccharide biosynthesis glycosyltransferase